MEKAQKYLIMAAVALAAVAIASRFKPLGDVVFAEG